jgi:hypothetical protein
MFKELTEWINSLPKPNWSSQQKVLKIIDSDQSVIVVFISM